MKLIRKAARPVFPVDEYRGECNACHEAVELLEKLWVVPLYKTEQGLVVAPGDFLECPHCHATISIIHITGDRLFQVKLTPPKHQGLN